MDSAEPLEQVVITIELPGRIIVAEDQHINVEILKSYMGELNLIS